MNNKTVKKFRNITRRSSIYMLFDNADTFHNQLNKKLKNEKLKTSPKNNFNSSFYSYQSNSISKSIAQNTQKNNESSSNGKNSFSKNSISQSKSKIFLNNTNTICNGHIYRQNRLPVFTNSISILKEIKNMSMRNDYYNKNVTENNFGEKYCRHNPVYEEFSKLSKEENLLKLGLNNEEKNPFDLIDKKRKNNNFNENINIYNNYFYKNDNFIYPLLRTQKNRKNKSHKNIKYNLKLKDNIKNNKIFNSFKTKQSSFFIKKDEFSHFLIIENIKKNYPSIISNNFCTDNKKEKKFHINFLGKIIEAREIYVIRDSTVISNPRLIPGFIVKIPTTRGLKELKKNQKINIIKDFLDFITIKFRAQLPFKFIFDKNGNLIFGFEQISENDKYIFVSPINIFQGISFSLHRGIFELYIKKFGKTKNEKNYYNASSLDESRKEIKNDNIKSSDYVDEYDDVYDIFFSKPNKNKIKKFKKIKKTFIKKNSFTFGIDDNQKNNYEYIYYSDSEKKRNKVYNKINKLCKNRIDFYLETKNNIYDKKLNDLRLKLSENKSKRNILKKSLISTDEELRNEFLSEKNIKNKNMLNDTIENRPLKCQDIIDTFKLLKSFDSSLNIEKFYKRKNSLNYFPYINKNIKDNTDKYCFNRKKTNLEYPSLLNYNIPKIIKENNMISLRDLIKYYTKFKSLINLWFNVHKNLNDVQFGIDFQTFYYCSDELFKEEEELAKKIYEKINNSPSGFLSLDDYIQALNDINQNDIVRQFYFFLKVFGNLGKKYLSFNDILQISLISIKRLARNNNTTKDEEVIRDLGYFFANYIFKICEANINEGIEIIKLKELLNSKGEKIEYLKLLLLFSEEENKTELVKTLKEFKDKNLNI